MSVTEEICCVGDFLRVVKKFMPKNSDSFYRGQRNSTYGINSSIYRLLKRNKLKPEIAYKHNAITKENTTFDRSSYRLAEELFAMFKGKHLVYPDLNIINGYNMNDIDLHVAAQHYGLATRVIDWTSSPLVALYFATEKKSGDDDSINDAAVFMIWNAADNKLVVQSSDTFHKKLESEIKAHKEIDRECISFYNKNYAGYKNDFQSNRSKYISLAEEFFSKLVVIINSIQGSGFIQLNDSTHYFEVITDYTLAKDEEAKCNSIFSWVKNFLSQDQSNLENSKESIELFNDDIHIIKPLPINQRVKNQLGLLMFSNKIDEEVYPASRFNTDNSVREIDDESLSWIDENGGLIKIIIPAEHVANIRNELDMYGFSKDYIYPEIMSFTEYMQDKIISKHLLGE